MGLHGTPTLAEETKSANAGPADGSVAAMNRLVGPEHFGLMMKLNERTDGRTTNDVSDCESVKTLDPSLATEIANQKGTSSLPAGAWPSGTAKDLTQPFGQKHEVT